MKLPEIWTDLSTGMWISRKAWKRDYAIQVCNLNEEGMPLLMHATDGFLFKFGQIHTDSMQQKVNKRKLVCGLQHDLFADDWYVVDQTKCDMKLRENTW